MLSQDFNVGTKDCDYQDLSGDVLNEVQWNDDSYLNGILGLDITWSCLLQMFEVHSGGDLFYNAQYMALQWDLVYWSICQFLYLWHIPWSCSLDASQISTLTLDRVTIPFMVSFLFPLMSPLVLIEYEGNG